VTGNGAAASGQPYQAIVGQFNKDGHADIWHSPEVGGATLWTAERRGFEDGGRWTTPRGAYPVGYGLTY